MSVRFVPVQWTPTKWAYDAVVVAGVVLYVWLFLEVGAGDADVTRPVDGAVLRMRAFGSCAFLMLTLILCIGPLARLDLRFLPVLYNRRHFGVLTLAVAVTHLFAVLDWYYAFSPTPRVEALLSSNTSYAQLLGFPFESLGLFALLVLLLLTLTSHDFWLNFLSPPVWKRLHLLIYPAYAAVVAHVALGALQATTNPILAMVVACGAAAVAGLHLLAHLAGRDGPEGRTGWIDVGPWHRIPDGRAVVLTLDGDERVAVFRDGNALSAVSNACAHQNGPLGEGRIVDGCITCPWHGFQYRPEDGCSPEPFTEKIPTYRLRLVGEQVQLDPQANPPGTPVPPLRVSEVP